MSKYYKADDVIRKRAEDLADTSYWEWGNPKNVDDWIEVAEMEFANLPTIEVMEYPQVEGITPTLITPEVSEDCISRAYAIKALSHVKKDEQWRTECIDNEIRLIKLLPSAVPQVPSEDCISRKWLEENKQVVSHTDEWGEIEINEYVSWEDIENAPRVVPTTEQSSKVGEWENYKDEHRCSECGEVVIGDWYDDEWYDYCPNCGAKMKGAEDEM